MISLGEFLRIQFIVLLKIAVICWLYIYIRRITWFLLPFPSPICYIPIFLTIIFLDLLILWYIRKEGRIREFVVSNINRQTYFFSSLLVISQFMFIIVFFGAPILISKNVMTPKFVLFVFSPIFFAPVVEEIIFRGLIQKHLLKKISPWLAILIASIVFALVHYKSNIAILQAFLSGIFTGFIYYRTDKIIICIIYHFVINLLAHLTRFSINPEHILNQQILFFIIATGLAVFSIRGLLKHTMSNKEDVSNICNKNE